MKRVSKTLCLLLTTLLICSCATVIRGNVDFSKIPHKSDTPARPSITNTTIYYSPISTPEVTVPKETITEQPSTLGKEVNNTPKVIDFSVLPSPNATTMSPEPFTNVANIDNNKNTSTTIEDEPTNVVDRQKKNKVISLLFLPLKDSTIKINLVSSRIRSIFAYEDLDVLIVTGINDDNAARLSSLFSDFTPYRQNDSLILCNKSLGISPSSPTVGKNTLIATYSTDDITNIPSLKKPEQVHVLRPQLTTISTLNNPSSPMILAFSPNERSSDDFSAWSDITRNQATEYWNGVKTLENLDFYDAIENTRYNSSSSGPLYSDWTYKKANDEFRIDFLMLRGVGVADVFTMDIADISTSKDVARRGIFAHLVVSAE